MRNMGGLWTGTFHSICLRFLRMHSQVIGYRKDFSVYDKADQLGLVKECTKELNISDDRYPASAIARQISFLKGRLTTPAEFSQRAQGFGMEDKVLKVYRMIRFIVYRKVLTVSDDLAVHPQKPETDRVECAGPESFHFLHAAFRIPQFKYPCLHLFRGLVGKCHGKDMTRGDSPVID